MFGVLVPRSWKGSAGVRDVPQEIMDTLKEVFADAPLHVPPIFVVGKARHGKSTVRKIMTRLTGLKGGSCSDTIYAVWSLLTGVAEEDLRKVPKEQARPILVALGDWLTTDAGCYARHFPTHIMPPGADPRRLEFKTFPLPHAAALVQYAWQAGVRVLDGIRREPELFASMPALSWCGVNPFIVWVENPNAEDVPGDNFNISKSWAKHVIVNDGPEEELEAKCVDALRHYQFLLGRV
jgi:hypothetical protein